MIKVAIDSGPLTSGHAVRGIGVMVREQIEAIKKLKKKEIILDSFDFLSNNRKLTTDDYDIVHYPYFFPYLETLPPTKSARKVVVTIQDLIHLLYPKNYPPGIKGTLNLAKQKIRLRYADAITTISETSKKDIVRFLGIPSEKIHVIYLAPKKIFKPIKNKKRLGDISRKYRLPERFVLYIGDINYNKNIPNLIEACELADIPLVICGKQALEIEEKGLLNLMDISGPQDWVRFLFDIPHPEHAHYAKILEKFKDSKKVLRLGFVPDSDLGEIMNLAAVYCQASYYEGFGLPVLEAFACGTPVVISRTNALVEIAGEAALVADPGDPRDIAEKIAEVIKNKELKKQLALKGMKKVKQFTWEKTAEDLLKVYKKLAVSSVKE